jgi:hypothetical protein
MSLMWNQIATPVRTLRGSMLSELCEFFVRGMLMGQGAERLEDTACKIKSMLAVADCRYLGKLGYPAFCEFGSGCASRLAFDGGQVRGSICCEFMLAIAR